MSRWVVVDQAMIQQFADCTGDHQWIHVDPERARRESPFRKTIAHGYLTLSLLGALGQEIGALPENTQAAFNYGLDKVRFLAPVISRRPGQAAHHDDLDRDQRPGPISDEGAEYGRDRRRGEAGADRRDAGDALRAATRKRRFDERQVRPLDKLTHDGSTASMARPHAELRGPSRFNSASSPSMSSRCSMRSRP